ncbi:MAG: D-2-hydroxyacid dehydrogenase [Bacillota bacterium]
MKVVVWTEASARYCSILKERDLPAGAEVIAATNEAEAMAHAETVEVLICWGAEYPAPLLRAAPRLRLIQAMGAGVEGLLGAGAAESPVPLANARGANAPPIAEHVIALILAFARRLHVAVRNQANRTWDARASRGTEIAGQTLGIIGLGSIGLESARRARALGMRVVSLERPGRVKPPEVDRLVADRVALAAESDYLLVAVPLTPETRRIVGEAELAAMKPTACLINISRGQTVDEPALIRALQEGRIAGAGLDVTEAEPLPADSPLWELPGVIITPHVAASSPHTMGRVMDLVAENLRRLAAGQPLLNLVDKEKGY